MSIVSFLLATVSASDEIDPSVVKLAMFSFALSGLCVLVAGGLKLFAEQKFRLGMSIAALGLVLGLVELSFAWYVRHIDFQPMAGGGTAASPPLLKLSSRVVVPVTTGASATGVTLILMDAMAVSELPTFEPEKPLSSISTVTMSLP